MGTLLAAPSARLAPPFANKLGAAGRRVAASGGVRAQGGGRRAAGRPGGGAWWATQAGHTLFTSEMDCPEATARRAGEESLVSFGNFSSSARLTALREGAGILACRPPLLACRPPTFAASGLLNRLTVNCRHDAPTPEHLSAFLESYGHFRAFS